jgi:hypothetical protein
MMDMRNVKLKCSRAVGAYSALKGGVSGDRFGRGEKPLPKHVRPTGLKACR